METKKALELRKEIKARKPEFLAQDAHKKSRIANRWRRPRGIHSKMRLSKKSKRVCVSTGYGSPCEARGLDKNGLVPILVANAEQVSKIDKKKQSALFAKTGKRTRMEMLRKAKEIGISIMNVKNVDDEIKKIEDTVKVRKDEKAKQKEVKKKKEKDRKEIKDIEKKIEESEDDKKEREKKEKDRVLTKKTT